MIRVNKTLRAEWIFFVALFCMSVPVFGIDLNAGSKGYNKELDTSKVFIIIEAKSGISDISSVKSRLEIAFEKTKMPWRNVSSPKTRLGGLKPTLSSDSKTIFQDAIKSGSGAILKINIGRHVTEFSPFGPSFDTTLQVSYALYTHQSGNWRQICAGNSEAKGFSDFLWFGWFVDEYDKMAASFAILTIKELFPYTVTKIDLSHKADVTIKNTSLKTITGLVVEDMYSGRVSGIRGEVHGVKIAPGEKKRVSVLIKSSTNSNWIVPKITEIEFDQN